MDNTARQSSKIRHITKATYLPSSASAGRTLSSQQAFLVRQIKIRQCECDIKFGLLFRRHDNCDCVIIYDGKVLRGQVGSSGKRTRTWEDTGERAARIEYAESKKPARYTPEQAKELESQFMLASKPGKDDSAIADMNFINSREFANKFKGKYENVDVEKAVVKACRQLVKNRNGTFYEEAFFIDAKTGETVSYVKGKQKNGVDMPDELKKYLTNAREKSIIMIHNHPNSSPFSRPDYLTSSSYGSCYEAIAVGHNGDVFAFRDTFGTRGELLGYFEENGNTYPYYEAIRDYRVSYSKHSARGKSDFEARQSAWKDVAEMRGFIYEKR